MKIKICGLTQTEQIKAIDELGIDYVGMIFYEESSRYMLHKLGSKQIAGLDIRAKKVGVFVNAPEEIVNTMVEEYQLDLVQLHGDETPLYCKHISSKIPVIRAFRINDRNQHNLDWMLKPFEEYAEYFLLDTFSKSGYGGTGNQFNWDILKSNQINKPFFLSGGIGVEDIETIKDIQHPFFYGIDINSKIETSPGIKDIEKIKAIKELVTHSD